MGKISFIVLLFAFNALAKSLPSTLDLDKVIQSYKKSLQNGDKSENHLKTLATMGILQGTVNVEKRMMQSTLRKLDDIKEQFEKQNVKNATKRLKLLIESMQRDNKAIEILQNTLKLSMTIDKFQDFRKALKKDSKSSVKKDQSKVSKLTSIDAKNFKEIEKKILANLKSTHEKVNATVYEIVNKMESRNVLHTSSTPPTITSSVASTHKSDVTSDKVHFPQLYVQMPIWSPLYQIDADGFYRFRRQNDEGDVADKGDDEKIDNQIDTKESSEFDDDFPASSTGGGGGITGLIASLR